MSDFGLEWIQPEAAIAHPLPDGHTVFAERSVIETSRQLGVDEEAYQKISQILDHKIKYERVPVDAWVAVIKNFLPPRVVQHFSNGPVIDLPSGIFKGPSDTLEMLLGHKPSTLEEFANEYRDALSGPAS